MFGVKINEFDNSDGNVDCFNKIFPNTPLKGSGQVEILGISEGYGSVYVRDVLIDGEIIAHDFGKNNFNNPEMSMEERIRFKYFAISFDNRIIASAFNMKDLAEKMNCGECLIKSRLQTPVTELDDCKHLFNVRRVDL